MRFAIILVVLVVACGGPATADIAPVERPAGTISFDSGEPSTTIATSSTTAAAAADTDAQASTVTTAEIGATSPDAELVEFEALWLCDAQRQTFDSPGAVDQALNSSLGEAGIGRADYDAFKAGLSENAVARKQILDLFVTDCS